MNGLLNLKMNRIRRFQGSVRQCDENKTCIMMMIVGNILQK
jgi:hypothetical protein